MKSLACFRWIGYFGKINQLERKDSGMVMGMDSGTRMTGFTCQSDYQPAGWPWPRGFTSLAPFLPSLLPVGEHSPAWKGFQEKSWAGNGRGWRQGRSRMYVSAYPALLSRVKKSLIPNHHPRSLPPALPTPPQGDTSPGTLSRMG